MSKNFEEFGFREEILSAIKEMGFKSASKIQSQAIPHVLNGQDLIAQAATGSGKTAAFGLPALELLQERKDEISLLVLCPTRELSSQVAKELNRFAKHCQFKTLAVFGGTCIRQQTKDLQKNVQAIVASPGRLLDLLRSKKIKNFRPSIVVLDEADEMLDMGFLEDIREIFRYLPEKRQSLLFSATMPKAILKLANDILDNPLQITLNENEKRHSDIEESYYLAHEKEKERALLQLIDYLKPTKSIIFCKTKRDVERVYQTLLEKKLPVRYLHGDIPQKTRELYSQSFRDGQCKFLVASDLAARGLNIPDISHVFNYHAPQTKENYTHRIGRTGRAGKKGSAVCLFSPQELQKTKRLLGRKKEELNLLPLPSLEEIKDRHKQDLVLEILEQKEHQDSQNLFDELQKKLQPKQIGVHLLSLLLKEKQFLANEVGLEPNYKDKKTLDSKKHKNRKDRQKERKKHFKRPNARSNANPNARPKKAFRPK